jgi:hypothetical protein
MVVLAVKMPKDSLRTKISNFFENKVYLTESFELNIKNNKNLSVCV